MLEALRISNNAVYYELLHVRNLDYLDGLCLFEMNIFVILADWLPRLERLAELRGLDTFEKNVLLVLTGSMVSKNLRNTGTFSIIHRG